MLHYKYTRAAHLKSILEGGFMAFPLFRQLNDPFESSIESTLSYLRNDVRELLPIEKAPTVWLPLRPGGVRMDNFNDYWSKAEPKRQHNAEVRRHNDFVQEALQHLSWCRDNIGICSLTTQPDDVVMWAHYAGNGTGVCIGFDLETSEFTDYAPPDEQLAGHANLFAPVSVRYEASRPRYSMSDKQTYVRAAFFTKYDRWSYEREVRLIRPISACTRTGPVPLFRFPRDSIREVNIGAAAHESLLAQIRTLVADLPEVTIRRVRVASDDYRIELERLALDQSQ